MKIIFKLFIVLFLFIISACSHTPKSERKIAALEMPPWFDPEKIPESSSIQRWNNPQIESTEIDWNSLKKIEIPESCNSDQLFPSHPQQTNKIYHLYREALLDFQKIPFDSKACLVPSRYPHAGTGKFYCMLADSLTYVVISDTFEDLCGNLYRGFWNASFFKKKEKMTDLLSKGRTVNRPQGVGNVFLPANTYALKRSDFLFLLSIFEGDQEKINLLKDSAKKTHTFSEASHLYITK